MGDASQLQPARYVTGSYGRNTVEIEYSLLWVGYSCIPERGRSCSASTLLH